MQTQPKIEFENMEATQEIKDSVAKHVAELAQIAVRAISCRVVVKAPSPHHREGGLYEVHIHLTLPEEREVNVERSPTADERRADLTFAINDAFKRARRQLQDLEHRTRRR
jgi:ribosome-associated translation inhibitor RaiA